MKSYKLPVKIIRPFNTFGPRQSSRAVIPTIIYQALNNKNIKLGSVKTTRDYTYVTDVCNAYLHLLKVKNIYGEPINVGSNNEFKIIDIAKKIIKQVNPKLKVIIEKRIRPLQSEVQRLRCNNKLILKKLLKPKVTFDMGLKKQLIG